MRKLFGTEALAVIEGEVRSGIQAAIYVGTDELQRGVIAETSLGPPRSR